MERGTVWYIMKFGTVKYSIKHELKCVILRCSMNCGAVRNITMFCAVLYALKSGTLQCSAVWSVVQCSAVWSVVQWSEVCCVVGGQPNGFQGRINDPSYLLHQKLSIGMFPIIRKYSSTVHSTNFIHGFLWFYVSLGTHFPFLSLLNSSHRHDFLHSRRQ